MDYSFKAVKTLLPFEQQTLKNAQQALTVPVQYGAMPDLGRYSQPDRPFPTGPSSCRAVVWWRLERLRKRRPPGVSRYLVRRGRNVGGGGRRHRPGYVGGGGDADFQAALNATREIRRRCPDLGIEMGMASEMVLGMHGELEWEGLRLAGLWPHQQMRLAAKRGRQCSACGERELLKSLPWNLARALTLVKPCSAEATIPIHMNVGMGVGGVPMAVRGRSMQSLVPHERVSRSCTLTACRWAPAIRSG